MSGLERARAILAEFGKTHGIGDFILDGSGVLSLRLEGILYVFQYNETLDALALMAAIGPVPPEAREMIFRQLLTTNLLWDETGGCTFAFEPSEEQVVMQYNLDAAALSRERFSESYEKLRPLAHEWRIRLRGWIDAELRGPVIE